MKTRILSSAVASAAITLLGSSAYAQTSTWNVDANGNWGTASNWAGNIIADGAGNTANFAFDISVARTVTLDTSRTIGNLFFDDTGATGDVAWTLNSSGGSILTLDNGGVGTTSTITNNNNNATNVNSNDATIGLVLAGPSNVLFNNVPPPGGATGSGGVRTINLGGLNTYTGSTTIVQGNLNLNNNTVTAGVAANSIISGVNGAFGNSTTAIILGTAATVGTNGGGQPANVAINVQSGTDGGLANRLISRDIDSSTTANVLGRNDIRFNNNGSTAQGTLTVSSNWTLAGGALRTGNGLVSQRYGQTVDFTGAISGGNAAARFRINDFGNGNGTVRLSGNSSYVGQTNVTTGTLLVAGNAPVTGPGALGNSALLEVSESGNATGVDARALIDGAFVVAKPISLADNSTVGSAYVLGGNAAAVSSFTGNVTPAATVNSRTLRVSQVAGGTVSFTGLIGANTNVTGVLNLQKIEAGTAILNGAATNTYDGTTSVLNGTLLVNGTGSGTSTGAVAVTSVAAQSINTTAATTYLSGGIQTITLASVAGLVEGQSVSSPLTAATVGTLGGAGATPNTPGNNPFAPGTYIQSINAATGVVTLSRPLINSVASGQQVNFGATSSTVGGNGTIAGALTVDSASFLAPGSNAIGTLAVGSATISGTVLEEIGAATSDTLADAGALTLNGTSILSLASLATPTASTYTLATYGSLTGTFGTVTGTPTGYTLNYGTGTNSAITLVANAVPEPTTFGVAAAASAMLLRRRRSAK